MAWEAACAVFWAYDAGAGLCIEGSSEVPSGVFPGPALVTQSDELHEMVRKWLRSEGYPLEYAAARAMRQAKFGVMQGASYTTDDGRVRDIDVLCQVRRPDRTAWAVLECKASPNPWVALMREGRAPAWSPLVHSSSFGLPKAIKDRLTPTGRFGYTLVQAFKSSDQDPAYTALSQVTSAARRVPEELDAAGFAVPVLVVSGPLFTAWIEPDGNDQLAPAEWVRLVWAGGMGGSTIVDVVNARGLGAYAERLRADFEAIYDSETSSW